MAKVEIGSSTVTATGPTIIILNDGTLNITDVVLFVGNSTSEIAVGHSDGTTTFTGSYAYLDANFTKTLTYYRNIGGTKTKVFETVVTDLDVGEFTINTTTLPSSLQIKFVAYGN